MEQDAPLWNVLPNNLSIQSQYTFTVPSSDTFYLHFSDDWETLLMHLIVNTPAQSLGLDVRVNSTPPRELEGLLEGSSFWCLDNLAVSFDALDARAGPVIALFEHHVLERLRVHVAAPPTEDALRDYLDVITARPRASRPCLTHLELYLGTSAAGPSPEELTVFATTYALMPIVTLPYLNVLRIRTLSARITSYFLEDLAVNGHKLTELDLRSLHPGRVGTTYAGVVELWICASYFPALEILGLDLNGDAMVQQGVGIGGVAGILGSAVEVLRIGCGPITNSFVVASILKLLFPRLKPGGFIIGEEAMDGRLVRKWREVPLALHDIPVAGKDDMQSLAASVQNIRL